MTNKDLERLFEKWYILNENDEESESLKAEIDSQLEHRGCKQLEGDLNSIIDMREEQITTLTNENEKWRESSKNSYELIEQLTNEKKQLEEKLEWTESERKRLVLEAHNEYADRYEMNQQLEQYKNSEIMTEDHKICARNGADIAYENAKLKKVIDEIVEWIISKKRYKEYWKKGDPELSDIWADALEIREILQQLKESKE